MDQQETLAEGKRLVTLKCEKCGHKVRFMPMKDMWLPGTTVDGRKFDCWCGGKLEKE